MHWKVTVRDVKPPIYVPHLTNLKMKIIASLTVSLQRDEIHGEDLYLLCELSRIQATGITILPNLKSLCQKKKWKIGHDRGEWSCRSFNFTHH